MNKYTAHGYLAADPELRHFSDGTAVVNFAIGVTKKWKDKESKEIKEKTEWPRFVATGRQAEIIAEFFKKGSEIVISDSELRNRSYDHKDGYKVYISEFFINLRGFEFCGRGNSSNNRTQGQENNYAGANRPSADYGNDIPF